MTMDDLSKSIDINSDTFDEMKRNFNFVIQRLLGTMEEKGSYEGTLTLKLDISLASEFIPNFDPDTEGETREVHKPKFKHKITSSVKINDEKSGSMDSEMELYMDDDGIFKMKPIANTSQRSIFDADFRDVPDEEENIVDEQSALPGRKIMSLPEPKDEQEEPESPQNEENSSEDTYIEFEDNNAPTGDCVDEEDIETLPFCDDEGYNYDE